MSPSISCSFAINEMRWKGGVKSTVMGKVEGGGEDEEVGVDVGVEVDLGVEGLA